jgi:hypothetical protein
MEAFAYHVLRIDGAPRQLPIGLMKLPRTAVESHVLTLR